MESAKLNNVEPYADLTDVLQRMVDGHSVNRLDELLPWAWKAGNPVKT
jgi:transposase